MPYHRPSGASTQINDAEQVFLVVDHVDIHNYIFVTGMTRVIILYVLDGCVPGETSGSSGWNSGELSLPAGL